MKRKILSIMLFSLIFLSLAGCGNEKKNNNLDDKKNEVNDKSNNETGKEKTVICNKNETFELKMESVYLKGDKLIQIENSHTYKDQGNDFCEEVKGRFDEFNNIKGLDITVLCDTKAKSVYDKEVYIVDEIINFDDLSRDVLPSQLGGAYFDEDTHEFNLKFWLEGKNTQGFTCKEK